LAGNRFYQGTVWTGLTVPSSFDPELHHFLLLPSVSGKTSAGSAAASCELDNLPDDLKVLVADDNKLFAEEIEKWDRELARKAAGGGSGDADVTIVAEQKPGQSMCLEFYMC